MCASNIVVQQCTYNNNISQQSETQTAIKHPTASRDKVTKRPDCMTWLHNA